MANTKVKDLMACDLQFVKADATLKEAAEKMKRAECGVLPVGQNNRIEGMITDRDIVTRAVAQGKDPNREQVKSYMSKEIYSCQEGDTLNQAADEMRRHKVGRLIVMGKNGEPKGILSFGHILREDANPEELTNVVELAMGRGRAA